MKKKVIIWTGIIILVTAAVIFVLYGKINMTAMPVAKLETVSNHGSRAYKFNADVFSLAVLLIVTVGATIQSMIKRRKVRRQAA